MREVEEMNSEAINGVVIVRQFVPEDSKTVEEVERRCEVGPPGQMTLLTDLLGDPISRIRHSSKFLMLVAEIVNEGEKEIAGMIRGCIKTVTCGSVMKRGKTCNGHSPICTKVAYVLGLRVSPSYRRMGIASKLVSQMEEWFIANGAHYSYMATEIDNKPSLNLFTKKFGYSKFRTPSILVQPVYAHRVKLHGKVTIINLHPLDAEVFYRTRFSTTEFFAQDIDQILNNKLNLGTYIAVPTGSYTSDSWPGSYKFLSNPPDSWAIMSIWNTKEVFAMEIKGASGARKIAAKATRLVDKGFPWLNMASIPQLFKPFGLHFLYGLGHEGPSASRMMKALCCHAHNVAKDYGCSVVVTEVASMDPLRLAIPHWNRLSCAQDVWCIKRLVDDYGDGSVGDWTKSSAGSSLFVDPREF